MTGYLIAALVILLIIGPVMWLKPSPGEARRARLRLLARELGLQVRLCNLPQVRRARVRREDTEQGVMYLLPLPEPGKLRPVDYCLVRAGAGESWENENAEPLPPELQAAVQHTAAALPGDAVALSLTSQGPAVYWRERGDEATVRALAAELGTLRARMAAALAV